MTAKSVKWWSLVHKWTSLVCTAFMLLLCLTGLPLVFGHELDVLLGDAIEAPELSASQANARATYDAILRSALTQHPGHVPQYMIWEPDEPMLMLPPTTAAIRRSSPAGSRRLCLAGSFSVMVARGPSTARRTVSVMVWENT